MSSYSSIECFKKCPYQWKLKYVDKLEVFKNQDPNNALYLGLAIHKGLETESIQEAIDEYKSHYYYYKDDHVDEIVKLEIMLKKALELKSTLGDTFIHELPFQIGTFKGFVDLLVDNHDGTYDLYDYKYCSPKSIDKYLESPQLHVYKYILETMGYRINRMGYFFIPKEYFKRVRGGIKYQKTVVIDPITKKRNFVNKLDDNGKPIIKSVEIDETNYSFRNRLKTDLTDTDVFIKIVEYDPSLVIDTFLNGILSVESQSYPKQPNSLCNFCDFKSFCESGDDTMLIPNNVRRNVVIDEKPDFWIYADSYVGKSTFVDQIEDLLFLNTDGNTDNTSSPFIPIKKTISYEGRIRKEVSPWEVFENVIDELEEQYAKGSLTFKSVAIDLIEDVYECCRHQVYSENGWTHESDGSYGKGYDLVKTRFTRSIKRLKSIGLQLIYISKEIKETIQEKNGVSYNTFRPNIQEKVANMLTGTVDLTVRAYMVGEDRYINLQKNDREFGGGRYNFDVKTCSLDIKDFLEALKTAQIKGAAPTVKQTAPSEVPTQTQTQTRDNEEEAEAPKSARRRSKIKQDLDTNSEPSEVGSMVASGDEEAQNESPIEQEAPVKRSRRTR